MKKILLFVTTLFVILMNVEQVFAQTEVYSNGNVRIAQNSDGWQVLHGTNVIAHGDGTLDVGNLPPMFQDFLEYYAKKEVSSKKKLSKSAKSTIVWGPYLKTKWNQDAPFNDECPVANGYNSKGEYVEGQHVYAGCVTISSAQVMNFFKFCNPLELSGKNSTTQVTTINSNYFRGQSLTVSNGKWLFTFNYQYSYTPDFEAINTNYAELAKFIVGIAFAQQAEFGLNGTSTSPTNQKNALENMFGYECIGTMAISIV
jgi:hypothetical protein